MTIISAYTKAIIMAHRIKSKGSESVTKLNEVKLNVMSKLEETFLYRNSAYADTLRKKTKFELIRLSGAVCGIEFCYAAETAFVSPTLLGLGLQKSFMSLMWCFSPVIGMILSPVLGSLSDNCSSPMGRRRPFIILLSVIIVLGLIFTPNGKDIGYLLDDTDSIQFNGNISATENNGSVSADVVKHGSSNGHHRMGIFFTVIGTVLLDFGSDACQSPARTYLLDVTTEDDHAVGLSMFTVMAGLGGSMGYAIGGINWEATSVGESLGGHIRAVFTLVTIVFVILVILTITSFKEIPLQQSEEIGISTLTPHCNEMNEYRRLNNENVSSNNKKYGINDAGCSSNEGTTVNPELETSNDINLQFKEESLTLNVSQKVTWKHYLKSIVRMPKSVRWLCITNLFCWMSLVCYSLYFTDFVGECVFEGDPDSDDQAKRKLFEEGVRFGCWGMCVYSLSCSAYSLLIGRLIKRVGAKPVYISGQLVYSLGMIMMGICRNKIAVILLSSTAGVMYATLFTMPYMLVAQYHSTNNFGETTSIPGETVSNIRGIGTDIAVIGGMAFVAQLILSSCMGAIIDLVHSSTATVCVSSVLSGLGAFSATRVLYLDL
ncbi:Uncharacterised protein g3194 [Pycnogonum litorale]